MRVHFVASGWRCAPWCVAGWVLLALGLSRPAVAELSFSFSTFAGSAGSIGTINGTGTGARFFDPYGLGVDSAGNVYVSDTENHTVRKITPSGSVTVLAGTSVSRGTADGTGSIARFNNPTGIAVDSSGNLYVADTGNHTIRRITAAGTVTTVAGSAGNAGSADATASAARFSFPTGLTIDRGGNVYVADTYNHTIRRVTATGVVTTLAGTPQTSGAANGVGGAARFNFPAGLAADAGGNILVADTENHLIRKISPNGTVTTVAGLAGTAGSADGTGSAARFRHPYAVVVDSGGNALVADSDNNTIRRVTADGVVTTLAGSASSSAGSADGPGPAARFNLPTSLALNAAGNLFVTDTVNCTVRQGLLYTAPIIAVAPSPVAATAGGSVVLSVVASGTPTPSYQWQKDGVSLPGATDAALTVSNVGPAAVGQYTVVVSNDAGSVTSAAVPLTVASIPNPGRLINLSILTSVAANSPLFTVGTVLGGASTNGTKAVLVRAVGPSLTPLGVTNALADPKVDLFFGQTLAGTNDNWGGTATLGNSFASVGAFAYASAASRDAALYNPALSTGNYTVQVSGVGAASGTVLAEIYEATPSSAFTLTTPRLINVSVLKQINGGEIFTAGFVIGGASSKQVLIRAVGPGLTQLGVVGVMADPKLDLFSGQTVISSNNDWGGSSVLSAAFIKVGAFALSASSKDAALLIALSPGNYTVQVSGVGGTGGVALVEVYEVP